MAHTGPPATCAYKNNSNFLISKELYAKIRHRSLKIGENGNVNLNNKDM